MKIRDGFVTNSSSTCFVVVFDAIPQSAEDVEKWLRSRDPDPTFDYVEGFYGSAKNAAAEIYDDITRSKPNDRDELRQLVFTTTYNDMRMPGGISRESMPQFEDFMDLKGHHPDTSDYDHVISEWTDNMVSRIFGMHDKKFIYILHYGNDGGRGGPVGDALRFSKVLQDLSYWWYSQ